MNSKTIVIRADGALQGRMPDPLFVTATELDAAGCACVSPRSFHEFAGHDVVSTTHLRTTLAGHNEDGALTLGTRVMHDAIPTTGAPLAWQYSYEQAQVIIDLAEQHNIRAVDAAAYIAHLLHPDLGALDSHGTPVTTLEALPKNTAGRDQRQLHLESNFPFSATPPATLPDSFLSMVVVHGI